MYAILCDIFLDGYKIFLKPHPGDTSNYKIFFKKHEIINKKIPSELIRFMINKNFDVGICTYSSSIENLKPYINKVYIFDDTITNFKKSIFKLYFLFELAKQLDCNLKSEQNSLYKCLAKLYNLNGATNISFDLMDNENDEIIAKEKYFAGANIHIKINEYLNDTYIEESIYIMVNNSDILSTILNFKLNKTFQISKVSISTNAKLI